MSTCLSSRSVGRLEVCAWRPHCHLARVPAFKSKTNAYESVGRLSFLFPSRALHMADGVVAPELARVKPAEVAEKIKSSVVAILDVRDAKEVAAGRIRGSINVPSSVFKSDDPAALDEVIKGQLSGAKEVVVHCHFCKVRGPTCAQALNNRLKVLAAEAGTEVKVLEGGIAAFMDEFKDDQSLVELPEGGWNSEPQH